MQMQKWFQNINIDDIYNSLRLSVRYMYRIRWGDPQELSVVSGVRCKIRILKILCSILLFPFSIIFFLINNVINKLLLYYITPNILFIKLQKLYTCTSMCSKLIAHFGPISEMLPTFPSQPLDDRTVHARSCISRAS